MQRRTSSPATEMAKDSCRAALLCCAERHTLPWLLSFPPTAYPLPTRSCALACLSADTRSQAKPQPQRAFTAPLRGQKTVLRVPPRPSVDNKQFSAYLAVHQKTDDQKLPLELTQNWHKIAPYATEMA